MILFVQVLQEVSNLIQCIAFWLSLTPFVSGQKYILRMLTQDVTQTVHSVNKIYDSETLGTISDKQVRQNSIVELTPKTEEKPLVYEYFNQHNTLGRFALGRRWCYIWWRHNSTIRFYFRREVWYNN